MAKSKEIVLVCPECYGTGSDLGCDCCDNTGRVKYKVVWDTEEYEQK